MGTRIAIAPCSTRPGRGRQALALWLLLGAPLGAEDAAAPLPVHGFAAADAVHALVSIAAGDAQAVSALEPALWHRAAAIPDHDDPDLAVRWTRRVADALARCAADRRAAVLAAIERAAAADLAAHPDEPWRARDFLPAPSAIAVLRQASARAFDHGDFASALESGRLLADDELGASGVARLDAAALLSGLDERIDPAKALRSPGEPVAEPLVLPPPGEASSRGLRVAWLVRPGWILALVEGAVAWQYRVDLDAEVVTGPGAALVRDRAGTRLVAEDGEVTALPPPPAGTRLLAVGGGAAWFSSGQRAWRLPLHGGTPTALELGAEPVCAPLVRGDGSLWLLSDRLALFRAGAQVASMRHHLAVGAAWRLAAIAQGAPAIAAPDGDTWRIEPLEDQLARATSIERARLQLAAAHPQDALALLRGAEMDQPAARAIAFAAHVALGAEHLRDHADEVAALAAGAAERDLVRLAAWRATAESAQDERAARLQALQAALSADPSARTRWTIADLEVDEERCQHLSTAAVLLAAIERQERGAHHSRPLPFDPLLPDISTRMPVEGTSDVECEDAQLGHVHATGKQLVVLRHANGDTVLSCLDSERRALMWRARWRSDESAPSRALALRDGCAVVAEGTSRLIVVDLASGTVRERLGSAALPLDPSRACIAGATVVVPSPLDDAVAVAHAGSADPLQDYPPEAPDASMRRVELPTRLRWLLPAAPFAAVIVDLNGERAIGFDGGADWPLGKPLGMPAGLLQQAEPPAPAELGVCAVNGTFGWDLRPEAAH